MNPDLLARSLQDFLIESPHGVVMEEGQILFHLESARYSVSAERGRCLLHMWSEERNLVREIVDCEARNGVMRLSARRFAQARPHMVQICRERDQRTAAARKTARTHYARVLEAMLEREFPGWTLERLSTSMNLERSLSPVYTRALLRRGNTAFAVLGVNAEETQASVDAALTFGLLWLDDCRQREAGRSTIQGLRLYVPPGGSATLRVRMAYLNRQIANFHLAELEEGEGIAEKECSDLKFLDSRLMTSPDSTATRGRFAACIARVSALLPDVEVSFLSPGEISFRLYGLEFARARLAARPDSFHAGEEIVFGLAGMEHLLTAENEDFFQEFVTRVAAYRTPFGDRRNPIWRMYPERWLESLALQNITAIDSHLDAAHVYSQVPAVSASDRSLIDVLTCTSENRLAVVELKADEDIHLPIQGLDYWARVCWHHERGDFHRCGYFTSVPLASGPPLLFLVAPALRVHPAVDSVLRYFSPSIQWCVAGIDERWREGIRVVFRKSGARAVSA